MPPFPEALLSELSSGVKSQIFENHPHLGKVFQHKREEKKANRKLPSVPAPCLEAHW
jgi:hypothetical protein